MSREMDRLDIYFNEDSIIFEDECGGQYSISCSNNGNQLTVETSELMEGLEFLGIDVH